MSKRLDLGWLWHGLAGLGIEAALLLPPWVLSAPLWVVLVTAGAGLCGLFALGYVREKIQHLWQRLTAHQWLEAVAWPLGGAVGALAWGLAWVVLG